MRYEFKFPVVQLYFVIFISRRVNFYIKANLFSSLKERLVQEVTGINFVYLGIYNFIRSGSYLLFSIDCKKLVDSTTMVLFLIHSITLLLAHPLPILLQFHYILLRYLLYKSVFDIFHLNV